ncbi:MAG: glycosyltransferase family 39 protein [Planctomycetota bacterium]
MRTRPPSAWYAAIAFAILAGAALRFQGIATESLWFDEVAQVEWNKKPFLTFLSDRFSQVDPPLNEIIIWVYNNILRAAAPESASSEFAIRLPVVIFGLCTIPIIAFAAFEAFGAFAGVLAAWLFATMPYAVRYGQEARMYSLTILLSSVALYFLVRALKSHDSASRARCAIWFGIASAAAAYSHYYALLTLAAAFAATLLLWFRHREERLRPILRGELIGFAIAAPFIVAQGIYAASSGRGTRAWLSGFGDPTLETIYYSARAYCIDLLPAGAAVQPADVVGAWFMNAAFISLGALLLFSLLRKKAGDAGGLKLHLICMLLLPPIVILAISQKRQIFHPRYLLSILPALVLMWSCARPKWVAILLSAAPLAVGLAIAPQYRYILQKPDYRAAAESYIRDFREGDAVDVSTIDHLPFLYYVKLLGSENSGATAAVRNAQIREHEAPQPNILTFIARTPPAGSRIYEIDVMVPWSRLYMLDALKYYKRRIQPITAPEIHKLIFESKPFPAIRVWRVDSQ